MLKRLFISLLILSAITSEGVVNFPGNIFNLYLFSSNDAGLFSVKDMDLEKEQNAKVSSEYTSDALSSHAFLLSSGSFEKLKLKSFQDINNVTVEMSHKLDFSTPLTYSFFAKPKKELIIDRSDSSPPSLI